MKNYRWPPWQISGYFDETRVRGELVLTCPTEESAKSLRWALYARRPDNISISRNGSVLVLKDIKEVKVKVA